jgi:uncharacterized repeat protein (TIGR03803 family)
MRREENLMSGKRFSRTLGAAAVVVAAVLIITQASAPGAWAACRYKTLFAFTGGDGYGPYVGLIFDSVGNLYGTTFWGGAYGFGTVFRLSPNENGGWTEKVVNSFNADGTDGYRPDAGLIFDQAGNLYGTTYSGGAHGDYGTVFKLARNSNGGWTESVIHSFNNDGTDGHEPAAGLIFDPPGNIYGTTYYGGAYDYGTVFKLARNSDGGWTERVLHSFNNDGADGYEPAAALIFDQAGSLYGTTPNGGAYDSGTVFQLTPNGNGSWTEKVLYAFDSNGFGPFASLIFDPAGNLYGTTLTDGAPNFGRVFKLKPSMKGGWKETVPHSFKDHPGAYPYAGLILDGHGNLYGTTAGDGVKTWGSVFEITP